MGYKPANSFSIAPREVLPKHLTSRHQTTSGEKGAALFSIQYISTLKTMLYPKHDQQAQWRFMPTELDYKLCAQNLQIWETMGWQVPSKSLSWKLTLILGQCWLRTNRILAVAPTDGRYWEMLDKVAIRLFLNAIQGELILHREQCANSSSSSSV